MVSKRSTTPVHIRYGSKEMRDVFEDSTYLRYQLLVESKVAEAQSEVGLIPKVAAKEIASKANLKYVTIKRWREIESVTHHETASLVEVLTEVCKDVAKPWIHYGLTSNDILDTALSLQLKKSFKIIKNKILFFSEILCEKALKYKDLPAVGRTHGQHASIIPFGLKFAVWISEMVRQIERLEQLENRALLCKTLGVVGTGSVMGEKALEVLNLSAKKLGLKPITASTQIIPRDILAEVLFFIALTASILDKIATEIRNLQRTEIQEMAESFSDVQIGSSAVPIKRNPINCERVSSLAKLIRVLPLTALENIPLWHERDLSNSANERITVPTAFVLLDECLNSMIKVMESLVVRADKITANINLTRGQIYSEFILDILLKKNFSRSKAHRLLNDAAKNVFKDNISYDEALLKNKELSSILTKEEILNLFNPTKHFSASKIIINNVVEIFKNKKEKLILI